MSGKYIEQKFASSANEVFDGVSQSDALSYTNADNYFIGKSNADTFIKIDNEGTTVKGNLVVNGNLTKSDGSSIVGDGSIGSNAFKGTTGTGETVVLQQQPTIIAPVLRSGYVVSQGTVDPQPLDTADIADGAITTTKLASGSITADKIADSSITSNLLADNSVESRHIKAYNVQAVHLGINAVQTSRILNGAVTEDKIADSNVTTTKIADGAVTANKVSATTGTGDFVLANAPVLTGNVGIGTTAPTAMLDVAGDIKATSLNVTTINSTQVNSSNIDINSNMIMLNQGESGDGVSAGTAGIEIERGSASNYKIVFNEDSDKLQIGIGEDLKNVATEEFAMNGSNITDGTITTSKAKFTSGTGDKFVLDTNPVLSGNVGIGTTTPTAKLDVYGDIKANTLELADGNKIELGDRIYLLGKTNPYKFGVTDYSLDYHTGGQHAFKVSDGTNRLIINNAGISVTGTISGNGSGITKINADNISSGTINAAQIPNLSAAKITSGTMSGDRISGGTIIVNETNYGSDKRRIKSITNNTLDYGAEANHVFRIGSNEQFRITADTTTVKGHLGVGAASSATPLYIRESLKTYESNSMPTFMETTFSDYTGIRLSDGDHNSQSLLIYAGGSYGSQNRGAYIQARDVLANRNQNGVVAALALRLQPEGGNVGIGTNTPTAKLDVNGDIKANTLELATGTGDKIYLLGNINSNVYKFGVTDFSLDYHTSDNTTHGKHDFKFGATSRFQVKYNYINAEGEVRSGNTKLTSDDRVKSDEVFITSALDTVKKIRPQEYNKWSTIDYSSDSNATSQKESGVIAQELYIDAPELRHLVTLPEGSDSNAIATTASNYTTYDDLLNDPYWPEWSGGESNSNSIAYVNYTGLIPYAIQAIKELSAKLDEKDATIASLVSRIETLEGYHV